MQFWKSCNPIFCLASLLACLESSFSLSIVREGRDQHENGNGATTSVQFFKQGGPEVEWGYPRLEWWQEAVIYQVYPRSFQDSNGDGVGDLNGITSRLDYFVELGITCVWINPFYKSPMKDFGYDVQDFKQVDELFGTLQDFSHLVHEAHKRRKEFSTKLPTANRLKIIIDIIPNHSSEKHEWFQKSIKRISPYTDFYVWKNATGLDKLNRPKPPTNWVSVDGGSVWEWNEERAQFYLHTFLKEQPDFNFENPLVHEAILDIAKFWMDVGVDGFRLDAAPYLYEAKTLLDEPRTFARYPCWMPGGTSKTEALSTEWRYWDHIHTYNQPQNVLFLRKMQQLVETYKTENRDSRLLVIEAAVPDDSIKNYYGEEDHPVSHFPFNFHLLQVTRDQSAREILTLMDAWYKAVPSNSSAWPNFLIGNHDQNRASTKWTKEGVDAANMINLLMRGTAITYYGEELGMEDSFFTWEETVDPQACNTAPDRYHDYSRDPARAPMMWNNQTSAGFSTNLITWLPVHPSYETVNVAAQQRASESHWNVYRSLLKLRQRNAWRYGDYESRSFNSDKVIGFTRIAPMHLDSEALLVLANVSDEPVSVDVTTFTAMPSSGILLLHSVGIGRKSFQTGDEIDLRRISLEPRKAVVIEFQPMWPAF